MNVYNSGFNSNKKFSTNVVLVKAHLAGKVSNIMAIEVPRISTILNVPGLSMVAKQFVNRGLCLADESLVNGGDVIENIGMVLGSNADHILPARTIVFGDKSLSSYHETPLGVMLIGSLETLKENMKFLPCSSVGINTRTASISCTPRQAMGVSLTPIL